MNTSPLLSINNLSKNFGGVQAIHDLSFNLAQGELLGLIGPNGSGKTTAVNLITGFVKPTEGEIIYRGKKISGMPPYKIIRMGIARTFQMVKPFYQLPAYKNMIIPLYSPRVKKMIGGKYGDRDAVALDLLELAKAIALQPDLIILDELFSGLSLAEVASIVPIIEKLRLEDKTIIMIEHRLKELFRIADRIIVLNYGEKIAEGNSKEVMDSDAVKKAYLGAEA